MNQALISIVLNAVKEKYVTEKAFYTDKLGISAQSWDRFKKGSKVSNMRMLKSYQLSSLITNGCSCKKSFVTLNV